MNKEELEKEAEVFATYYESLFPNEFETFYKAFLKVAEPREKRITELKAENEQIKNSDTLCKLIGEQKRKIVELEAQIEKMKCCYNCKHSRTEYEHCRTDKHEKWEIKENEK